MKLCLACGERFEAADWTCPSCANAPLTNGFVSFAPPLAESPFGFALEAFDVLPDLEEQSFWFRSRNRLILSVLRRHFPDATSLLEVGCGTGYVLSGIHSAFPELALAGGELARAGLEIARQRLPNAALYQMDALHVPFVEEFDVVAAFDVLEHLDDDESALRELYRAVRPGGGLLVSVPQHPRLWSVVDEYSRHRRRYSRGELVDKLERARFSVTRVTSFVTLLLPVLALSRFRQPRRVADFDPAREYSASRRLDRSLERIMDAERALIDRGFNLPAGGSLLAVALRP